MSDYIMRHAQFLDGKPSALILIQPRS